MAISDERSARGAAEGAERARLSPPLRALLIAIGSVSLALGVIGIAVPVLPTTPFLLLAAACYARSSQRLYRWLLGQPSLGRIVSEWRRSRSLAPGVKIRALIAVAVIFAVLIVLFDAPAVRLVLIAVAAVHAAFIYRIPTAEPSPP